MTIIGVFSDIRAFYIGVTLPPRSGIGEGTFSITRLNRVSVRARPPHLCSGGVLLNPTGVDVLLLPPYGAE